MTGEGILRGITKDVEEKRFIDSLFFQKEVEERFTKLSRYRDSCNQRINEFVESGE